MDSATPYTSYVETRIGQLQLSASQSGIRRVYWPGEGKKGGRRRADVGRRKAEGEKKILKETAKQLGDYFDGKKVQFTAKLDLSEFSPFAQRVLRELAKVPYGKTISYGELAKKAGSPKAARAVGSIVAKNPLPIIVPCHRVIRSDGSLGGYSGPGGAKLKRQLLLMEKTTGKETPCSAGG